MKQFAGAEVNILHLPILVRQDAGKLLRDSTHRSFIFSDGEVKCVIIINQTLICSTSQSDPAARHSMLAQDWLGPTLSLTSWLDEQVQAVPYCLKLTNSCGRQEFLRCARAHWRIRTAVNSEHVQSFKRTITKYGFQDGARRLLGALTCPLGSKCPRGYLCRL